MEYSWLCKPQFFGVRAAAANIGTGKGTLTAEQFQQMFPQFYTAGSEGQPAACLVPAIMLDRFIAMANASIIPSQWGGAVGIRSRAVCGALCHPLSAYLHRKLCHTGPSGRLGRSGGGRIFCQAGLG